MLIVLLLRLAWNYCAKQLLDYVVLFPHHEADARILLEREGEAVFRVKKGVGGNTGRPVKTGQDMLANDVQWEIV